MKKFFLCLAFFSLILIPPITNSSDEPKINIVQTSEVSESRQLYDEMNLEGVINFTAFEQAFTGYKKLKIKNKDIVTIIDFSKPSTEERMYVLDLKHKILMFHTHVSHGKNSGANYATSFSNKVGSFQSSLGFYVTENTYIGKNGYSLVLDGLERGINDKAKERAIVVHGAAYSNPSVIGESGRLGRSFGCPAIPPALSKIIINTIKGGTLMYIYADNQRYLAQSSILTSRKTSL